jgi:LysR family glycine cleavage system transcriptional activator
MRRLSPLNSLRAFETAARWLSFAKAAEELFVTPAAVSQQIKQLEGYLGVTLFHRMTRAVRLTEEAKAVLPLMTEGFDKLAEAVDRLSQEEKTGLLTVSTAPTFAAKWLLQRLPDFSDKYPNIDLRLHSSRVPGDFDLDGIDISIRLSTGDYPRLHAARVFGEEFSPVCSPSLLAGPIPLRTPKDLKNHHLLHVEWGDLNIILPDWRMWTKTARIEGIDLDHGPHFTVESMAIEAAINGNGIALVSHHAAAGDLQAGRLVRPFDLVLQADFSYWLVCPHEHLRRAKVKAFCDWLLEEAANDTGSTTID